MDKAGFQFSSANSINIGRLVPQVVYYVYAYAQLLKEGQIKENEVINVVVPTGNFGNILAAYFFTVNNNTDFFHHNTSIAPKRQFSLHLPHLMHLSESISCGFFTVPLIADTGQFLAHNVHPTHLFLSIL